VKFLIGFFLASLTAAAAVVLGTPSGPPASPAPAPSVFCPAGQHVAGMHDGIPVCVMAPAPKPTGLDVTP
jgi:hypothetical protein